MTPHHPINFLFIQEALIHSNPLASLLIAEGHEVRYLCPGVHTLNPIPGRLYSSPAEVDEYDFSVAVLPRPYVGKYAKQLSAEGKWVVGGGLYHQALASRDPSYSCNILSVGTPASNPTHYVSNREDLDHAILSRPTGNNRAWVLSSRSLVMEAESPLVLQAWSGKRSNHKYPCQVAFGTKHEEYGHYCVFISGGKLVGPVIPISSSVLTPEVSSAVTLASLPIAALRYSGPLFFHAVHSEGCARVLRVSSFPPENFWLGWAASVKYSKGIGYALLHMARGTLQSMPSIRDSIPTRHIQRVDVDVDPWDPPEVAYSEYGASVWPRFLRSDNIGLTGLERVMGYSLRLSSAASETIPVYAYLNELERDRSELDESYNHSGDVPCGGNFVPEELPLSGVPDNSNPPNDNRPDPDTSDGHHLIRPLCDNHGVDGSDSHSGGEPSPGGRNPTGDDSHAPSDPGGGRGEPHSSI